MVQSTIVVNKKRYYYYKTYWNGQEMMRDAKRFPHTKYYWVKMYSKKARREGYDLYLSRWIA